MDIGHYRRIIEAAEPNFQGAKVRLVAEEGQYNDAFVVDDRFIFRFPRYQAGIEMMRRGSSREISPRPKR